MNCYKHSQFREHLARFHTAYIDTRLAPVSFEHCTQCICKIQCSSMLSTISVIISEPYLHKQLLWNQSSILEHTNLLFSKDYWSLYLFGKCITGNGSCCLRQMQKIIATFKKSKVALRIFIPTTYRKGTYVSKFENECCPDLIWFRFL
jgi:hypothetical protein